MNLPVIIRELPENVAHVYLAANNIPQEERDALALQATERGLELIDHHGDVNTEEGLLELARMAEHIIVLPLTGMYTFCKKMVSMSKCRLLDAKNGLIRL